MDTLPLDDDRSQAERVFEDYLARVSRGETVDFDALCDQHQEVASTLRRMKELYSAVDGQPDANQASSPGPQQVGPYRLRNILGEGGMGTVYLAEQEQPVQRRVALKLIKLGMDSKAVIQRFQQERQALALMDHDGIAKVFDCGTSERGQPYFVMELVKGVPIDEFCEQQRLSLHERLELIQQVCAAVQHAHQKGVVHRDLKPGNVLVTDDAGRLQVKIIDFGLAKAMGSKLIQESLVSQPGIVIGTYEYMAPEQANPSNLDIDTRADIYSIGVMLYQVLVGELPFSGDDLRQAGPIEMQRILREVEPPKPSTRLTTMGPASSGIAQRRRVTISTLKKALKTDLDWVVLKALEKDRNRRYGSATALAEDLQRYLDHEPLLAGPPSTFYRLQKMLRRYRSQVVAAALLVVTLLGGGIGTLVQWRRAEQQASDNLKLADQKTQLADENQQLAAAEALAKEDAQQSAEAARIEEQKAKANAEAAEAVVQFVQDALVNADPNQGGEQGFLVVDAMDQAIEQLQSEQTKLEPKAKARLLRTIARILNGNARPRQALELAQQALAIERELQQGDTKTLASSLNQIGQCLVELNRNKEALLNFEEALAIKRRLFSGDHRALATGLQNLAFCLQNLRRAKEALPLFEEALAMNRRLFGGDHRNVATNLSNLAGCLRSIGRKGEALQMHEESLAITRRLFPKGHPDVARGLNNVANSLSDQGRNEDALLKYRESLAMLRRLFEGDHPRVAGTLNNLGLSLYSLGRTELALAPLNESLAMRQNLFPDGHLDVANSLGDLAGCLMQRRRFEDALRKCEEAMAMMQRLGSGDHPRAAINLNNVAICLLNLDRTEEALPRFRESLAMRRRLYRGDNPDVLRGLNNLAFCLMRLGADKAALPYAIEADAMARRALPEGHPSRQGAADALAKIRAAASSGK